MKEKARKITLLFLLVSCVFFVIMTIIFVNRYCAIGAILSAIIGCYLEGKYTQKGAKEND